MAKPATLSVIFGFAIYFTLLFHNKPLGINLLLFEGAALGYFIINGLLSARTFQVNLLLSAQLITCVFTVITHSAFGYLIHYLVTIIFIGVLGYPEVKSLWNSLLLAFNSFISSQRTFIGIAGELRIGKRSPAHLIWESRLFAIPSIIIFIFITIYNFSNPKFNSMTADISSGIYNFVSKLFAEYDFTILFTLFSGLLITNFFLLRTTNKKIISYDALSSDMLSGKDYRTSSLLTIKNEMRSAVFLLLTLNVILLVVNVIDINWVWFNFKWEGQYLKQFVHEGTWLLIISILLSIAIILFFFRGAINFQNNKTLKYLCYTWIFQNAILAVSVAIRNLYYIGHFNLAYKRIGVILFLVLTVIGLLTVWIKVSKKYSAFYLLRTNFNALLSVLIITSLINWDSFIARYNYRHSDRAFIHFNFLAGLSMKSLPLLDKPLSELKKIDESQKKKFPNETFYITPDNYYTFIQKRKELFRKNWEAKGWLSWNLPEQLAYNKLFLIPKK